jgi:uncharacterized membrane protein YhhN
VSDRRTSIWEIGYLILAIAATAADAMGEAALYRILKGGPMILALIIASSAAGLSGTQRGLLQLAFAASLAGDLLLLSGELFFEGLVAFLLAHVVYLVLFTRDSAWFPSRVAAFGFFAVAAIAFVVELPLLPGLLIAPVAIYATAIAAMSAQAVGRASVLRTAGAWLVAIGALTFVASDTILSINRFIAPFPFAGPLNMTSYYLAQFLILIGMTRRVGR